MGFSKSKFNPNLYLKVVEDELVILLLYVDDLFLTGNEKQIVECKKKSSEEFRPWSNTLFPRSRNMKESFSIRKRFDMLECKVMATPMDSNLKLLADESSELVDVTHYR